jgi:hypothetical protein
VRRPIDLAAAAARARDLVAFADGLDAFGEGDMAGRIRDVAVDLLDVVGALLAERMAHRATLDEVEELRALLGRPNPFLDDEVGP